MTAPQACHEPARILQAVLRSEDIGLDKEEEHRCEGTCFFRTVVGLGDHVGISPTGKNVAAEQARAAQRAEPQRGGLFVWLKRLIGWRSIGDYNRLRNSSSRS
jgi:hypothetical protein